MAVATIPNVSTPFRVGAMRMVAQPAAAALDTDELLALRRIIDAELERRAEDEPALSFAAGQPIMGPRLHGASLRRGVSVLGMVLSDRYRSAGADLEVTIDRHGDVTVFNGNAFVCTHANVLEALRIADEGLSVKLPRPALQAERGL